MRSAGRGDLGVDRGAPLLEAGRGVVHRLELTAQIREAGVERGDLGFGALAATRPVGDVGGDLAEPAGPQLRRGLELAELQPGRVGIGARLVEMRALALQQSGGFGFITGFVERFLGIGLDGLGFGER